MEELKDKNLLISKIIDVYRVAILRKRLEISVEDITINSENILDVYLSGVNPDTNNKFKTEQKELIKEYFSFLNEVNNDNLENTNEINYYDERLIQKDKISNYDQLVKTYNKQELKKIRFNFTIKRFNANSSSVSDRYKDYSTHLDIYFKKYPSWASVLEKNNDFIRGQCR